MRKKRDLLKGFPPIANPSIQALVLGSFPSVQSLTKKFYYAHPQNAFWRIMEEFFSLPFMTMLPHEKSETLLAQHIGLWDTYHACIRSGSADSAIRYPENNPLITWLRAYPYIQYLAFNGKTAGRIAPTLSRLGYQTTILPSTSPAYTIPYTQKFSTWHHWLHMVTSIKL